MNISYNWLKRYLKTDLSAEEMATILTDIADLRASWSARC